MTILCVYFFLTPNSWSIFRAGVSLNIHLFTHSLIQTLTHSYIHSLIHSFTHSFIHSLIHSLTHSLIHSLTHSFIHSLTHSFIPGAIEPKKCPLGYKEYDGSLRRTFNDTCEPCLPGTFGAQENRTICEPCRAGVVCLAMATTDNPVANDSSLAWSAGYYATKSYLCPPGEICMENN